MVHDTKKKVIFLPSTIRYEWCAKLSPQSLIQKEIALCKGQVNDSLQAIRLAIEEKSFWFWKQLQLAASKKKKTCSWDGIHIVGKRLQHYCLIYQQARHALSCLGVPQETLETEFQELMDDDLQTSSAIMELNAREQRKKELFWIWQRTGMRISNQITLVNKCKLSTLMHNQYQLTNIPVYHVNWLCARSYWDWKKEQLITGHEMVWIVLWFQKWAEVWRHRADCVDTSTGLASYAYQQASMWDKLKHLALVHFYKVHKNFSGVFVFFSIKGL